MNFIEPGKWVQFEGWGGVVEAKKAIMNSVNAYTAHVAHGLTPAKRSDANAETL
jgi:hypothetical protein